MATKECNRRSTPQHLVVIWAAANRTRGAGQCASATCEALRQPLTGSFAVQPAACWGLPSTGKLLFDHVLIDTPLLPGAVQPALFTAPQSLGSKSLFDFDFQLPVLPPLDLALPGNGAAAVVGVPDPECPNGATYVSPGQAKRRPGLTIAGFR